MKEIEIKSIICPHCRKKYMIKHQTYWKCPDCVISYPLSWFDEFHQFDNLINQNLDTIKAKKEVKGGYG